MITPDRKPKGGVIVNKVGNKSVLMSGSQNQDISTISSKYVYILHIEHKPGRIDVM